MWHVVLNWKTTIAGLGAVFLALGDMLSHFADSTITGDMAEKDLALICAGVVGIFARDASASKK